MTLAGCGDEPTLSERDAHRLVEHYTSALAVSDTAGIAACWSRRTREDCGFEWMEVFTGNLAPFSFLTQFAKDNDFVITGIEKAGDYAILHGQWRAREDTVAQPKNMLHYVVREGEQWVLAQPREVLTRDWTTFESDCFVYHISDGKNLEDRKFEFQFLDEKCLEICGYLGIEADRKIDYFKVRNELEGAGLMNVGLSAGYAFPPWRTLVSVRLCHVHEMVHILDDIAGISSNNPIFKEGFASAFGGVSGTTAAFASVESKNFLEDGRYIPLRQVFADVDDFVRMNFITYFEAGSFFRFLFDRYGLERLKRICQIRREEKNVPELMASVYGRPLEALEAQWMTHLETIAPHHVGFGTHEDKRRIFTMSDPEGDDTGDGDYRYPNERFPDGVFDLTKFEVFEDDVSVGFRLQFRRMIEPVIYSRSDEHFLPGAVIAVHRGGDASGGVQKECHGVRFEGEDGYDLKINVGAALSIANRYGRIEYSTPLVHRSTYRIEERAVVFSLPKDWIGDPDGTWRYFVGVGLMSDRTMNFFNGPLRVSNRIPVFIHGGNAEYGSPAFIDILLPEDLNQSKILDDYDTAKGNSALVPMVGS